MWPQKINFAYAGGNCFFQPTLFSDSFRSESNNFQLSASKKIVLGSFTIAALEACITPVNIPRVGNHEVMMYQTFLPFLKKQFVVSVPKHPVASVAVIEKPISISGSFEIPLSATDFTFGYIATFDNAFSTQCDALENKISCNVESLKLKPGTTYQLRVDQYYENSLINTIVDQAVTTLLPTKILSTSVKNGATVYSKPKSITFVLDKSIMDAKAALVQKGEDGKTIDTSLKITDKKIIVSWDEHLKRQLKHELTLSNVRATDGSGLEKKYVLRFRTSGGPKVKSVSVGSYGVPVGTTFTITFDQPLLASQRLDDSIVAWGGARVTGMSGSKVFVSLAGVEACHIVRLSINEDLVSKYGIRGGSTWQFSTRTLCQTVTTIGYSVQGRPINAYWFGSGSKTVVYTGAIHGDESSTYYLMLKWIDSLEASPSLIPSGHRVVVIPTINPDGLAAGTRTNARNVDLNRNFATSDWKKNITNVYGQSFPGGGGSSPLSEPESKAIANLIISLKPKAVISYHSIGSVVLANPISGASQLAQRYAAYSGYSYSASSEETFSYSITGTADDYYAQEVGVASIVVELGSHTYHQFELNQTAMQKMMQ